jgi:hypothetical protein
MRNICEAAYSDILKLILGKKDLFEQVDEILCGGGLSNSHYIRAALKRELGANIWAKVRQDSATTR